MASNIQKTSSINLQSPIFLQFIVFMSWDQLSTLGSTVVVMVFLRLANHIIPVVNLFWTSIVLKFYILKKHKVARCLLKVLSVHIFVDNCYGGDLKYSTWCYPRCERSWHWLTLQIGCGLAACEQRWSLSPEGRGDQQPLCTSTRQLECLSV